MSMYLSNSDVRPIGVEPAEFIDFPTVNDGPRLPAGEAAARSSSRTPGPSPPERQVPIAFRATGGVKH